MKTLIFVMLLAGFLQTTVIPANLCLVLVIARSFVIDDKLNFFLAFFSGIMLGILGAWNIGFYPLIFLLIVKIISLLRKTIISTHPLAVFLAGFVLILAVSYLEVLLQGGNLPTIKIAAETLLLIPFYLLLRFWEERFTLRPGIKLKIRN